MKAIRLSCLNNLKVIQSNYFMTRCQSGIQYLKSSNMLYKLDIQQPFGKISYLCIDASFFLTYSIEKSILSIVFT